MSHSKPYVHPQLQHSYTRVVSDGSVRETVFDLGNGHAVQVREDLTEEYYVCQLLVVPQFPGASIYNSAPSGEPIFETVSSDEVTDYINTTLEAFMIQVDNVNKLQEEFDD